MHSKVVSINPKTALRDVVDFSFIGEVGWFAVFSVVLFQFLFGYFFLFRQKITLLYLLRELNFKNVYIHSLRRRRFDLAKSLEI